MGDSTAKPLISVIVPVYKVESYLRSCVDSILAQTYQNLEIILVDDGSPDSCGAICDAYAAKDSRVRVIHKENGGLSDARNAGMAGCKGDYLAFVDSDDLLTANALEILLSLAVKHTAELVIGGHVRFSDETECSFEQSQAPEQIMTPTEAMNEFFKNGCASWARLYKRSIHQDVPFPIGEINEDEAIVLQILERCERVVKTEQVIYAYRCRPESITTNAFSVKKLAWKNHCAANLAFVQKRYPELELDAAARYRGSLLWSLTEIALTEGDFKAETKQMRRELWENRKLFWKVPYTFSQDKLRLAVLLYLPFCVYRVLILNKRRNFTDET